MVHNLPEVSAQDNKERNKKDVEVVTSLIEGEFHIKAKIVKSFRAGKVMSDKHRPLIITLEEEGVKWDILRQAPQLMGQPLYGGVFLSPDRTREERERDRNLREKARRLREIGKTVRIQKGQVVVIDEGSPTQGVRDAGDSMNDHAV